VSFPHRKLGSLPSTFVGNRVAVLGDSHSDSAVSVERRGRFPSMVLAEFSAIVLSTASVLSAGWLSTFWQIPSDSGRHLEQFLPALTQQQFLQHPCLLHRQHADMSPGLAHL